MDASQYICTLEQFQQILDALKNEGYKTYGPTLQNQVIIYDEIQSAQDLPIGWMDEQDPGRYRLKPRSDKAYFGYNLGPHSWKKYLFPPREKLFSVRRQENGLTLFQESDTPIEKMAFLGVRACEIQAILIQDKVFQNKIDTYTQYKQRREQLFILAVNCTRSVNTCFCVSMGAGPEVTESYDLALTEIINEKEHYFVLQIGSERGRLLCGPLSLVKAKENQCQSAKALVKKNEEQMMRRVDNEHVHEMLSKSWDCKRWDKVAKRCINCAACVNFCPVEAMSLKK